MSEIFDLGEAVAKVLEPWPDDPGPATRKGVRTVRATSGVTVDLNMARPTVWKDNHLYLWPSQHTLPVTEVGPPAATDEAFVFTCIYAADRKDEEARNQMRRDVSEVIQAKAHAYASAIAHNRHKYADGSDAPWADLRITSIAHDMTQTFGVRGVGAQVSGNRHVTYA